MKANNKEYNNKAVEPLQVFDYAENAPVRVQVINGETWFVAKDVCRILGIINHKDAISKTLDDDERGSLLSTPGLPTVLFNEGM